MKRINMLRALVALIGAVLGITLNGYGATYYTAASGLISGNIWATTTNGTPAALPALANGDIIYIDDNIDVNNGSNFSAWQNVTITIHLNATASVEDQWLLALNTTIIFDTSAGKVIGVGPGNSEKIKFGPGNLGWSGDDGNLTGPGTLDKTYTSGPLPIELLFFKAKQTDNAHLLEWATASELNFDYFSIERSVDGLNFKEIEQVKGHGTTKERIDYSFVNSNPLLGKNYYRLKSVDFDGSSEYSRVVLVDHVGEKSFVIAPNPSSGSSISLLMNFVPEENTHVTIFDNSGMVVGVYEPTDSFQSIDFQNSLRSGLYFARLVSRNYVKVERFVVR